MSTLKAHAEYGQGLIQIPARFIFSWWAAENGYDWPENNNPGNISYIPYEGNGHDNLPSHGVFVGVTYVNPGNKVCSYATPEDGIMAWAELLRAPTKAHGGDKLLTVDLEDLLECAGDVHEMAVKIGQSNWAGSHYVGAGPWSYQGGSIEGAYHSTVTSEIFGAIDSNETTHDPSESSTPAPRPTGSQNVHIVAAGDTLSLIGLRYGVDWRILARYNRFTNPNVIDVGEIIKLPRKYVIKPGDTLSELSKRFGESVDFLALVNAVEPDRIAAGHNLYY